MSKTISYHTKSKKGKKTSAWVYFTNSVLAYVLSGFLVLLVYELTRALFAYFNHVDIIIQHNHIYLQESDLYANWNKPTMFLFHTVGLMGAALVSVVFFLLYRAARKKTGPRRLVYLWGIVHGANLAISYFMVGSFSSFMSELNEINMAFLFNFLQFSGELRSMFILLNIISLFLLGILIIKPFISQAHNHYVIRKASAVQRFLFTMMVLPWLSGSFFLILVRMPMQHRAELLTYLIMGVVLLPSMYFRMFTGRKYSLSRQKLVRQKRINKIDVWLLLLAVLLPLLSSILTFHQIRVYF